MSKPDQTAATRDICTCPFPNTIRLIGDQWTLQIVHKLLCGKKRFGELLETLGNVSPKTVSNRLKTLEEMKLVERHAYAEIPPRVEYSLTPKGYALVDILKAMLAFEETYLSDPTLPPVE